MCPRWGGGRLGAMGSLLGIPLRGDLGVPPARAPPRHQGPSPSRLVVEESRREPEVPGRLKHRQLSFLSGHLQVNMEK